MLLCVALGSLKFPKAHKLEDKNRYIAGVPPQIDNRHPVQVALPCADAVPHDPTIRHSGSGMACMHLPAVKGWPEFSDFLSSLRLLWDPAGWSVSSPTPEWLFDMFCRMHGISKDERKNYYLTPNLTSTGTKTFVVNDREETMKLNLVAADIDVDSDNENGLEGSPAEEEVEEESPGKLILVNDNNSNDDTDTWEAEDWKNMDFYDSWDDDKWDNDPEDMAAIDLKLDPTSLPSAHKIELSLNQSSTAERVRIFDESHNAVIGPEPNQNNESVSSWEKELGDIALPQDKLEFHVEGGEPGRASITLTYKNEEGEPITSDTVKLTVVDVQLEPISNRGGIPPDNPSGIVKNRSAKYHAAVQPASLADEEIVWKAANGASRVSLVNNTGRSIEVKGTAKGDFKLTLNIGDITPRPYIKGKVLKQKTVNVCLHVVRNDSGNNPVISVAKFDNLLKNANKYFEQAGMKFKRDKTFDDNGVKYIDDETYRDVPTTSDNYATVYQLHSKSKHTGGVEVYCVGDMEEFSGLNTEGGQEKEGLTMEASASGEVLAHELGHAAGLDDIYVKHYWPNAPGGGLVMWIPKQPVQEGWLYQDWSGGNGYARYYERYLMQREAVKRLLMYGRGSTRPKSDLALDKVYGAGSETSFAQSPLQDLKVGLYGIISECNREPEHW